MDKPAPDPAKLLEDWMEGEKGETHPGKVISNLKTHGLRDLLETLSPAAQSADASARRGVRRPARRGGLRLARRRRHTTAASSRVRPPGPARLHPTGRGIPTPPSPAT